MVNVPEVDRVSRGQNLNITQIVSACVFEAG